MASPGVDFIKVGRKAWIIDIALSICALRLCPTFWKAFYWCIRSAQGRRAQNSLWNRPQVAQMFQKMLFNIFHRLWPTILGPSELAKCWRSLSRSFPIFCRIWSRTKRIQNMFERRSNIWLWPWKHSSITVMNWPSKLIILHLER